MFKRELYLSRIRPFYDNEQIKIIMGVRRCGKTEILKMIMAELASRVAPESITYLSFELFENRPLREAAKLYAFLSDRLSSGARHYVMLDEIQFVEGWPEVVNSIKTKFEGASIFLTGSNSALLNDDTNGVLGGRTISFRQVGLRRTRRSRRARSPG